MKLLNYSCALIGCLFFTRPVAGQSDTLILNLRQVIELAQGESPDLLIAKTAFDNNYWRYQTFRADLRPQIDLSATLPNINRSINPITQPDGREVFLNQALMRNSVNVGLSQRIAPTGGEVFVRTGLQRLDVFRTATNDAAVTYLSNPVSIGLVQPVFAFNRFRWEQILEPIRFEEARRNYSEDLEQVAFDALQLFFEVLIAQYNLEAARRDRADADTLYQIAQGRFEVGRIAETELLQFELGVMNADADLQQSALAQQTSSERLRDFLGIGQGVEFQLLVPENLPDVFVNPERALELARRYRSESVNFERRLAEGRRDIAEAQGNTGLRMNVFASFGLSQKSERLNQAFVGLIDQENIMVGIEMPLADWGKTKARREVARSNFELAQRLVERERVNFEREVLVKAQQFDLVRRQVELAARTYEVAAKRRDMSRNRYLVGRIGVTDLNIAIGEEIAARRNYIAALRNFWVAYYELRRLTLYDFERERPLVE
jgi:outer membrane protein